LKEQESIKRSHKNSPIFVGNVIDEELQEGVFEH